MKKIFTGLVIAFFSFSVFLFNKEMAYADTVYGPWEAYTEDGKWDGTLYTTSADRNVAIDYGGVTLHSKSTGEFVRMGSLSDISFRLCNASTGACTSYKRGGSTIYFTNMKANQKYYIDIIDHYSSYYAGVGLQATVY